MSITVRAPVRSRFTTLVASSTLSVAAVTTLAAGMGTARAAVLSRPAAAPSVSACMAGTKAIVAKNEKPLHPLPPTVPVKGSVAKGALVVAVIQNAAIGAYQYQIQGLNAAAKALGAKLKVLDSKGATPNIIQNMSEAVALHPKVIIDDSTVAYATTQLIAAKNAHIPVVDDTGVTADANNKAWGLYAVTGSSSKATVQDGIDAAALAISSNHCTGTYVQYYSPTIPASDVAVNGVKSVFSQWCPSCKLVEQAISPDQLVTGVGPLAQTFVNRYANLKAFFMPDQQLLNAHASIAAIHWKGELIGYFDSPFTFAAVRSGTQYADISSSPLTEGGWSAMDEAVRAMAKAAPVQEKAGTQTYIVTKANVPKAPATDLSSQYGDYEASYLKVWGIKGG